MKAQKIIFLVLFICLSSWRSYCQENNNAEYIKGLKVALKQADNDTLRAGILIKLSLYFLEVQRDSAIGYFDQAIEISKKSRWIFFISTINSAIGYAKSKQGEYAEALNYINKARAIAEDPDLINEITEFEIKFMGLSNKQEAVLLCKGGYKRQLASLFALVQNNELAEIYYLESLADFKLIGKSDMAITKMLFGSFYLNLDSTALAMKYFKESLIDFQNVNDKKYLGVVLAGMADIYAAKGENELSKSHYHMAIESDIKTGNQDQLIRSKLHLGNLLLRQGDYKSAKKEGTEGLEMAKNYKLPLNISEANLLLSSYYRAIKDFEKADRYSQIGNYIADSIQTAAQKNITKFHNAILEENIENNKKELEQISTLNRRRTFAFIVGLLLFSIIGILLYRNNRNKQKANNLLKRQKVEVDLQRSKVENALTDLKSTQAQLIQSEKMASLGELTAGIAHEIQNPLNFVNNFSEVSEELIKEVRDEWKKTLRPSSASEDGIMEELLDDVEGNLRKINHHGNRASSIVKGMIEHSRTSSGKKELTDINALADEYLRLAYHGLRAKDSSFNSDFQTDFDPNIPKVEVIPQDIGRVLLNLINNAFQAVAEQAKKGIEGYKPTLAVSTKTENGQVLISVKDNGPGIPDSIKDKIFQPFFTTKETGKGTGLGLSLAYNIVKAHGGELNMESVEGEGSQFIIQLPAV